MPARAGRGSASLVAADEAGGLVASVGSLVLREASRRSSAARAAVAASRCSASIGWRSTAAGAGAEPAELVRGVRAWGAVVPERTGTIGGAACGADWAVACRGAAGAGAVAGVAGGRAPPGARLVIVTRGAVDVRDARMWSIWPARRCGAWCAPRSRRTRGGSCWSTSMAPRTRGRSSDARSPARDRTASSWRCGRVERVRAAVGAGGGRWRADRCRPGHRRGAWRPAAAARWTAWRSSRIPRRSARWMRARCAWRCARRA